MYKEAVFQARLYSTDNDLISDNDLIKQLL